MPGDGPKLKNGAGARAPDQLDSGRRRPGVGVNRNSSPAIRIRQEAFL